MTMLKNSYVLSVAFLTLLTPPALRAADNAKKDAPETVYNFTEVDEEPLVEAMYYPDNVRPSSEGKSYVAILAVVISAKGRVTSVQQLKASDPEFGESAERHAKRWRFEPARLGSKAVSCATILTIRVDVGTEHANQGRGDLQVSRVGLLAVKPNPDGTQRPSERRYVDKVSISVRD